jgi:phenylacetate-coenzyme A ligase PaaK-like adenylate-forming protein
LERLPTVTKPQLMDRFDEWVTDPAVTRAAVEEFVAELDNIGVDFLGRYVVVTTSGSTGVPALLVQDRRAIAVMTGLAYVRTGGLLTPRLVARLLLRGGRQAAVFATGGHFLTITMFERRQRARPFRAQYARFFSVLEPLPKLVDELNAFGPVLLASYPSALELLAQEQQAHRLRLSPILISTGGEAVLPVVRRRVEAAFGCPLLESYSASEAAPLTLPCVRGRLHVNADWFILEPVDADGAPVPDGTLSHSVLVTNLANRVQPLIRYQLGDSVVMDPDRCPCGSPLPTLRVEGRTEEILRLPGPDQRAVALLPMALATVVEETPGVHRFQVVQTAPTALAVRLEPGPGFELDTVWAAVRDHLSRYLREQGLTDVVLELAPDPPRVSPRGGKLSHVVNEMPAVGGHAGDQHH